MSIHLLVVGQHKKRESQTEYVAETVQNGAGRLVVARCRAPGELVQTVRSIVLRHRQPIDRLDIFDHGRGGKQTIADEDLWDYKGQGKHIAQALRLYFTSDAHVRLLGCVTSKGENGRELLNMLDDAFGGHIVVHGTIKIVRHEHFDSRGFKAQHEEEFLFSSTQAREKGPPTEGERIEEVSKWMRDVEQATEGHIEPQS